jgi:hypothetical protein
MSHIEDLIDRYFKNTVSEEERAEIVKLIADGRIEEVLKHKIAQNLSAQLRVREVPDPEMKTKGEEIFQLILSKNASSDKKMLSGHTQTLRLNKPMVRYPAMLRYAAVFIILAVAGVFAYPWTTSDSDMAEKEVSNAIEIIKVVNSGKAAQKVILQDGSTVTLEPGSELRYNKEFINRREVYLSGDAFFDVKKDPSYPFYVYANEITTKVLGTSFRVKANQGEKEIVVAVKTGKVSVFAKSTDDVLDKNVREITLTPNQQVIYKRKEHVAVKKVVEQPEVIMGRPVLKDNYVNEPVILILKTLSESYGVEIRFDESSLSKCTLTSDIIEGEGLYDQLEIICNALGGTYKMENDASILIEANGCQSVNVKP